MVKLPNQPKKRKIKMRVNLGLSKEELKKYRKSMAKYNMPSVWNYSFRKVKNEYQYLRSKA